MDKSRSLAKQTSQGERGRPQDKYNIVYLVLVLHGIGSLMPWNMFINAEAYFRLYKLGPSNTTESFDLAQAKSEETNLTSLRLNFLSYLCVASQIPNLLFSGFNLVVNIGSGNLTSRVNITLIVEALIFTLTISLAICDSSNWKILFFWITLVSVVLLNMASGIYQNCVFGTGAKFPRKYTNAVLIGSNICGTFTSIVNLLSIWLAPAPQEAAIYYFVTALVAILMCLISYNLLEKNQFYRYHDAAARSSDNSYLSLQNESAAELAERVPLGDVPDTFRDTVDAIVPKPDEERSPITCYDQLRNNWIVLTKCWKQCLNTFLVFYLTLTLFPTVLADVKQLDGYFTDKYFIPFACFFVFNVSALLGNLISNYTSWPGKERVWILAAVRLLFIPFYLFCNYNPTAKRWPVYIKSDLAYILATIVFATLHGYLSSVCMMFASSGLKPDEAMKAGMLAAFFLVFGLFTGVSSSFFWPWVIQLT